MWLNAFADVHFIDATNLCYQNQPLSDSKLKLNMCLNIYYVKAEYAVDVQV